MTDSTQSEAKLVGGSESDRKKLLQLLDEYIGANSRFDWDQLQPMWSAQPEATFYNLNGHTYNGADHWRRLWAFYKKNVEGSYWTPFDIGGVAERAKQRTAIAETPDDEALLGQFVGQGLPVDRVAIEEKDANGVRLADGGRRCRSGRQAPVVLAETDVPLGQRRHGWQSI